MNKRFLRTGTAFTSVLVLAGCWGSRMMIKAAGVNFGMGGSRNRVLDTERKQFASRGVMTLRVRDDSGNIRVTAGDNDTREIAMRAEKIVEGDLPVAELNAYLSRVEVITHLEGVDTFAIEADYPREEFSRKRVSVSVNYTITVPNRVRLDLLSHSGNVEASGARAGIKAHSDSGNAILADIAGTIEATSHSGDVSATHVMATHTAQKVTLRSDSGNVDFEGDAGELDMHGSSGNVTGTVTGPHRLTRADLHTISGNVELTVPRATSATIQARTVSGSIRTSGTSHATRSVGDDGGRQSRQFTVGGGNAPITLETVSGNVEFSAR